MKFNTNRRNENINIYFIKRSREFKIALFHRNDVYIEICNTYSVAHCCFLFCSLALAYMSPRDMGY